MNKTARTLAIIAMASAFGAIALAFIFDVIAFREAILQFVLSLILPVIAFIVLVIAMIASIIFVFGLFLLKDYGFWPLILSFEFFKYLLSEIKISQEAIQTFLIFRYVLISICVAIIVVAIVSKALSGPKQKKFDENGKKIKRKDGTRAMSSVGLVFGILGLLVSLVAIVLVSQI